MHKLLYTSFFLISFVSLNAQTNTWNGTNGNWTDGARWSLGIEPTAAHDVVINSGTVTINNNADALTVTIDRIGGNATLVLSAGTLNTDTLKMNVSDNTNASNLVNVNNSSQLIVADEIIQYWDPSNTRNVLNRLRIQNNASLTLQGNHRAIFNGGAQQREDIRLEDDGSYQINGNLIVNHNGANSDFRVRLYDNSSFDIDGDFIVNGTGASPSANADFRLVLSGTSSCNVDGDMAIIADGIDDIIMNTQETSTLTFGEDVTVIHASGDDFEFQTDDSGKITIADSLYVNYTGASTTEPVIRTDLNGGSLEIGGVTEIITNTANADVDYNINRSTFKSNGIKVTMNAGDDFAFTTNNGQTTPSSDSVIIDGNFEYYNAGADNGDFNINYNSYFEVTGDLIIDINSADDDFFDWQQTEAEVIVGNLFVDRYGDTDEGANDMVFDIDGASSFISNGDFKASILSGIRDFYIRLANSGNAALGNGGSFTVTDTLCMDLGANIDDCYIQMTSNKTDKKIELGTLYINDTATSNDFVRLLSRGVNDSLIVNGDIFFTGVGSDNDEDDFYVDVDQGYFGVGGSIIASGTDIENIFFDIDNCVMNVVGDVKLSSSSGNSVQMEISNNTIATIGDSVIIDSDCDGTNTFYVNTGASLSIGKSINATHRQQDFRIHVGTDDNSKGRLLVGEDINITNTNTADDSFIRLYMDSYLSINNDLTFTNTMNGSGDQTVIQLEDGSSDTLLIGGNLTFTGTGGAINTDDDFFIDQNVGIIDIGGNFSVSLSGDDISIDKEAGSFNVDGSVSFTNSQEDILFNEDGGKFTVGGDINVTQTGDAITWHMNNDSSRVSGDFTVVHTGSDVATEDFTCDIDGGVHTIGGSYIHSGTDVNYTLFNLDDAAWLIEDDFKVNISSATERLEFNADDIAFNVGDSLVYNVESFAGDNHLIEFYSNTKASVGKSLSITNDGNRTLTHRLGRDNTSSGQLLVGEDYLLNHTSTANDLNIQLYQGSRFSVIGNGTINMNQGATNNTLSILMDDNTDTLAFGGNFTMNVSGGNSSTDDNITVTKNVGDLIVGNNWILNFTDGNVATINDLGGKTTVGGDVIFTINATDDFVWRWDNDSIRISGDLLYNNSNSSVSTFNIDAGTHTIDGKMDIDFKNSDNADISWDQDGGVLTIGEDFYITLDSINDAEFRLDAASSLAVEDSLVIAIDSMDNFRFYLNDDVDGGANLSASNIYVTRENGDDIRFLLEGDAKIDVSNDIVVLGQSNDGDFIEFEMFAGTNDTLIVGNDMILKIPSGNDAGGGDGDIRFEVFGGRVDIGRNLELEIIDENTIEVEFEGNSDVDIGGYWKQYTRSASGFDVDIVNSDVDVVGDVYIQDSGNVATTSDYAIDIQGASDANFNEDLLIYLNSDIRDVYFRVDGSSSLSIADSMHIDIDLQNRTTNLNIGNGSTAGEGPELIIGSNLLVSHDSLGNNFTTLLNQNGKLQVGQDFTVNNNALDGDAITLATRSVNDTIIIGNDWNLNSPIGSNNGDDDFRIDFNAGFISVGNDFNANIRGGGDITLDMEDMTFSIGNDMILLDSNGRGIDVDLVDGTMNVGGEFQLYLLDPQTNNRNAGFDNRDGNITIGDDFYFEMDGSEANEGFVRLFDAAQINIGDSLWIQLGEYSNDSRIRLNQDGGSGAGLTVGTDFILNKTTGDGDDFYMDLNNDSKVQVGGDLLWNSISNSDLLEIEMNSSTDSIIVGGNVIMRTLGSNNADDDVFWEALNGGRIQVGGNVEMTTTDGATILARWINANTDISGHVYLIDSGAVGNAFADIDGGTVDIGDDFYVYNINADNNSRAEFEHNDGITNIGGELQIVNDGGSGGAAQLDVDAGSITVAEDILIKKQGGSNSRLDIDMNGGTITGSQDFYVVQNGGERMFGYIDGGAQVIVADTFLLDLDDNNTGSSNFLYLNQRAGGNNSLLSASNLVVDHEPDYGDFYIYTHNNGKIDIDQNIDVDWTANGGDLIQIRSRNADDSIVVGNDILMTLDQGSFDFTGAVNADDDMFLYVENGYLDVGNQVLMEVYGGSEPRFNLITGDVNIGGDFTMLTNNAAAPFFEMDAGTLDVLGEFVMSGSNTQNGAAADWYFDGGTANFGEDVTLYTNQINGLISRVAGSGSVNITDSLIMNDDGSSGTNSFYLDMNTPIGAGPSLAVGSFLLMDSEADAQDMYIQLNGNAKLIVDSSIVANHYADAGDDFMRIQLANADNRDSLIVGKNVEMNMLAGTNQDGNDIQFRPRYGYTNVAGDVILNVDAGGDGEWRMDDGETIIGGDFIIDIDNADDFNGFSAGGTLSIGGDFLQTADNADNLFMDIDGGTISITGDLKQISNTSNNTTVDMDGSAAIINVGQDWILNNSSVAGRIIYTMDGGSRISIGDSLYVFNGAGDNTDPSVIFMEDGGNTGSSIAIGGNFVYDRSTQAHDFRWRLEGDAKTTIGGDFIVNNTVDGIGGEYFQYEHEELNGNDTTIIEGNMILTTSGGANNVDDELEIEVRGGYFNVKGNMSYQTDGRYAYFDIAGGVSEINGAFSMTGDNAEDLLMNQNAGVITFDSSVYMFCDNCDVARFEVQGGGATMNDRVDVIVQNGSGNDARVFVSNTGTVTFNDTLFIKAKDAGEAELQSDGSGTVVFIAPVYVFDTNSTDLEIDFNGSDITMNADLFLWHYDSDEFNFFANGGTLTVQEDVYVDIVNPGANIDLAFNAGGGMRVVDSLVFNTIDNNDRTFRFNFDTDDNSSGSFLRAGTMNFDHSAGMGDVDFTFEGNSDFRIDNDLTFNFNASGGDRLSFYFDGDGTATDVGMTDSLYVGGDFTINHLGGNSGGDDLFLLVEEGSFYVENDFIINLQNTASPDFDFDLENGGSFVVVDSFIVNIDDWDDMNMTMTDSADFTVGTFYIDKENPSDDVTIDITGSKNEFTVNGDFTIDHDANSTDLARFRMTGSGAVANVNGDFTWNFNNSSSGNGDDDLRLTLSNGSILNANNNLAINATNGRDIEITIDSDAELNVGDDFLMNYAGGRDFYVRLGRTSGNGILTVDSNLIFQPAAGLDIEVELNNTSIADIAGDVDFLAAAAGQQFVDINNTSELRVGGQFDGGVTNFGDINSEANGIITYDGTTAQRMHEEVRGGSDNLSYGIVRIDNTSGLAPGVILDNTGVSATITGLYMDEGFLSFNGQTVTVTDGTSGRTTQTNGGVISENSDNILRIAIGANTGSHIYPFASNEKELLPFDYDVNSGNSGNVDIYTYETAPNNMPLPAGVTEFNNASGADNSANAMDRFWVIEPTTTGYNVDAVFPYADSEYAAPNTISESNLVAQRWEPAPAGWQPPVGSVNIANNNVRVSGVTGFSPWVLVDNNSPLPVDFISVKANYFESDVYVEWATASEINNDYFVVERSVDGFVFEEIGRVDGAGNSSEIQYYTYVDEAPLFGISFYRIRQVDFDEMQDVSSVVSVNIEDEAALQVHVYPNPVPADRGFTVHVANEKLTEYKVTLYSILQRTEINEEFIIQGNKELFIPTKRYSPGVYILKVRDGYKEYDYKLIIE